MELTADQQSEIDDLTAQSFQTKRPTVPALEDILYKPFPVLNHGFVRVVDYMGDDSAIVQAARVSYGRGTKQTSQDKGLINYLMRHRHTSPFEMCEIKLHVKLPIFVARHWVRHRTASINEYSARYSILDREFYFPKFEDMAAQSTENHQGRGAVLSMDEAQKVFDILKTDALKCYDDYEYMLNENPDGTRKDENRLGLARELARMNLPVSVYTQWYWKTDLHNLFHFLGLRAEAHAQKEIRDYANVILDVCRKWVPLATQAFEEHALGGTHLSKTGLEAVRRMLSGEKVTRENSGLLKGEWNELKAVLGIKED